MRDSDDSDEIGDAFRKEGMWFLWLAIFVVLFVEAMLLWAMTWMRWNNGMRDAETVGTGIAAAVAIAATVWWGMRNPKLEGGR